MKKEKKKKELNSPKMIGAVNFVLYLLSNKPVDNYFLLHKPNEKHWRLCVYPNNYSGIS